MERRFYVILNKSNNCNVDLIKINSTLKLYDIIIEGGIIWMWQPVTQKRKVQKPQNVRDITYGEHLILFNDLHNTFTYVPDTKKS